ncbi:heme biosynthesis protein HemY [Litoreibacter janthinus]|uniref:HemY protein n=1 Tax=Litoreibacter janthinus TaxID=670154 RepID=A0A1I6FVU2_9RHOB|nr:heme biosynthesis HemY N-terminal domain-containing protein [Litoreibacter janthinus]SFR34059.1 HemY protein [Litoreibacter janthinus]
MLWSLVKILAFLVVIVAVTMGLGMLLETSGGVRVSVANTEFTLSPLMTILGLVVLLAAFWVTLKLLGLLSATFHFLNGDETAISRYFTRNRERKGFEALADGLMALASGEGRTAMAKAAKAEKYLARPELTNLLAAQAAETAGDTKKAQEVYKRLLTDERTRFVGVRGIMKQKLAEGDTDTALKLAEKAFALKPKHVETQDVLLKLQAETEDWAGARKTLNAKLKHGNLPRDVHRRRDAVLALSEAKEVMAEGSSIEARETAIEANRLSPDLIPAAVLAAHGYIEQGKPKYAARVLKKAWAAQPHPDLAAAFAEIEPNETPQARIKRFSVLTRAMPDHAETKMLLAELNIAAEHFPEARRAIGNLPDTMPTARVLTIMAAIERGEGSDDAVVRGWLTRALSAPRGPQWVCESCHTVHPAWSPTCANCGSLDTLSWTDAPETSVSMPAGTAMLPLIVGALEVKPDATEAEEAEIVPDHEVIVVELSDEASTEEGGAKVN